MVSADSQTRFSYTKLANLLPVWKKELPWLKDTPSQALQQALKNLKRAYVNFFQKRADFPRFKKKGQSDSFRYPQGFKLDQPNSRNMLGTAKNFTVSSSGGKWFVSIQTDREIADPVHPATSIIGIDVGIARFATLSDGSFIEPLHSFKQHQRRLACAQRVMSRKQKFSNNWKKARARVQRIHSTIANVRRDFLHKTTTTLSKNHAMVCIEDLRIGNMSHSASGSNESPGRNVKAKSGLNKAILDQGWYEFRRQLDYKLQWQGGMLIAVPPQYTSQTCPACGHVSRDNRKTQAKFACVECGHEANADLVGAMNILAAGHAVIACGGTVQQGHPVKQKPAEATMQELAPA